MNDYRVFLAEEVRNWTEAERLQRLQIEWHRQRSREALARPVEPADAAQCHEIRTLATALHEFGEIQRELGRAECVSSYQEAMGLFGLIADQSGALVCAFNLSKAYRNLEKLRDLDQAESWLRRSLELIDEGDMRRAQATTQLGAIAYSRFKEIAHNPESQSNAIRYLNDALQYYRHARELLPSNAVNDLRVVHMQMGVIYSSAGEFDRALTEWQAAIRYAELADDRFAAGEIRSNMAMALAQQGRFVDARAYAMAAVRDFETFGQRAIAEIEKANELLATIDQLIGPSQNAE